MRLIKLEGTLAAGAPGVSSCSQPTIDYDLNDTRCKEWDDKIEHMDSYLAELGAGHLKLREQIRKLQDSLSEERPAQSASTSTQDQSVVQMVQELKRQIAKLEGKVVERRGGSDMEEKVRFMEVKLGVLQNDVVNCSRLAHFIWSCTQSTAARVQLLHDSTSTSLQQMAQLRAVFSPMQSS
eukprot:5326612-Amphidinium_carterae.2